MLTKKAKYALRALIFLAREQKRGCVLISEIARKEQMPQKFLERILLDLRKQGILQSRRGRGGGYMLGRPAAAISVGEVVRLMDGPLAPVSCVSQTAYVKCPDCLDEQTCRIRVVMKEVRDAIAGVLDGTSLEDMMKGKRRCDRGRTLQERRH